MVKFKIKANPSGQYYFPKEVREELGEKLELICNAKAAIVYSAETPIEIVLESIELIKKDLEHRLELQKTRGVR
jgi:bifunctional DNA-binding transcriptional regulator/antitoxin component of YhaV-PrlF toxin-antitoxin module